MRISADITQDAVVIVPGIMGSALRDAQTGDLLWGLSPSWYVRAWAGPGTLRALELTDDERAGRCGRVVPAGLLRLPAYVPGLTGLEPYTDLVTGVRAVVAHPDAVLEFSYDWRLPVEHNARRLAEAAADHLTTWRAHPSCPRESPDGRDPQLVFVAHSMGGLLVRALALPAVAGPAAGDIRASITIGTPFAGAAPAVLLLAGAGGGPPLPRERLRRVAATLPGLHDLLPTYRCVDLRDDARRVTPGDVAAIGGSPDLAAESFAFHERLASVPLPGHRQIFGLGQPTVTTLKLEHGSVTGVDYTFEPTPAGPLARTPSGALHRVRRHGDGTVPRPSAELIAGDSNPAQRHGSLASTPEVIRTVRRILTERPLLGARLGDGEPGLTAPDLLAQGAPWTIRVTGASRATCHVTDLDTGASSPPARLGRRDDALTADGPRLAAGLYRLTVAIPALPPITQLILVTP